MGFASKLDQTLKRFDFSHWGVAPLERPLSFNFYREWLDRGHHADMDYLKRHSAQKADPRLYAPKARSAVVVAKAYHPHPYATDAAPPAPNLRAALYARGGDYHRHFRAELEAAADALRADYLNEEFLCCTDSAPILERDLAAKAGLGWVGKNTCLIHPKKGSLFFIGEILTSVETAAPAPPLADFCGSCDRCIRACPTGALVEAKVLDARKCISYWTIEAKAPPPEALRAKFGDWFFGCDICQTVCPWNEKVFGRAAMRALSADETHADIVADLRWILTSSGHALQRAFKNSPMARARPRGLKRNALVVAANLRLKVLLPEIEALAADQDLGELATWAKVRIENILPMTGESRP